MNDIPMDQCSICENMFPDVGAGRKDDLVEGEFTDNLYCKKCERSKKAIRIEERHRKENLKFFSRGTG